ncbi:MAG TPA: SulP family inorganic anion transporter [Gemmataceae bacterium]|nr:SulP family inorganic anion transporter [Gemmataceae bacterium]
MSRQISLGRCVDFLPGLRVLLHYDRADLSKDLTAGVVVTLVLIPSAIAYADLAKCPPVAGLYAALGGMVAFALLTSSRHVIVGPDAAIAIMVGAAIGPLASGDPGKAIAVSAWLALLVACILLLAAWLRLGAAADFLSSPVMLGFMNGAAVVIIGSQLGKFTNIRLEEDNTLLRIFEWVRRLPEVHWPTLAFGMAAIGILAAVRVWFPRLPGTIVVFALALVAGRCFDFAAANMQVIGSIDTSVPTPVPPELSVADLPRLFTAAVGLAFLIFPEGILLGRAMAGRHGYEIQPDRELVALGAANLIAGLFRSFAVGGSQSRTLLNSATGGRTQMVSFAAAALLVAFLYFLASWIATLPTVAIAAILIFTGFTLIDVREYRKLRGLHRTSARLSLVTTAAVIGLGVLPGILVGVFLSLLHLLTQIARPQDALLGRVPGSPTLHDVGDDEAAQTVPGLVVYRFYGPLVFANIRFFTDRLEQFLAREEDPVRQVILDARAIPEIDVTAAEQLRVYLDRLRNRGITFVVAKAHLPLREAAVRLGLQEWFGEHAHFSQLPDAVAAFSTRAS